MRLGLLQSSAALDRQAAREAAEAQAKKHKRQAPTVKTEEQTKADEAAAAREKEKPQEPPKAPPKPRIRPLSEAKAIDTGANFISEAFLFLVAGGLIVFESMRSRRKESSRREDVADRLAELEESEKAARNGLLALEHEVIRLRSQLEDRPHQKDSKRILPKDIWEQDEEGEEVETPSLLSRITHMFGWPSASGDPSNSSSSNPTAGNNTEGATATSTSTQPTAGAVKPSNAQSK